MQSLKNAGTLVDVKAIRIAGTKYDRRYKVLPEQRDKMTQMYESGVSTKEIAALFQITRARVYQIINRYQQSSNKPRYSAEYRTNASRKWLEYKRSLFERGLIPF